MAVTFGQVKSQIALVAENGIDVSDSRLIPLTNQAQQALMNDVPRGIFVGGVMSATISITNTNQIVLPATMENVFEVEPTDTTVTTFGGWYNVTSTSVLVDPDEIKDTALVDLGINGGGFRVYAIPELPTGTSSVNVTGLKAFAPITGDSDPMAVPNARAIVMMILALRKLQRTDQLEDGEKLRQAAVKILVDELVRNIQDPTRYALRLAQWRIDEKTYAPGTLGNMRARIALDVTEGQKYGRIKINRMVSRAIAWINQRRYEYQLVTRNRVKTSVPTVAATVTNPTDVVAPFVQFEIVRQLVQAMLAEDHQGLNEDRGTGKLTPGAELVVSQKFGEEVGKQLTQSWDAELEQLRHTTYAATLQAFITANNTTALGYVTGKFALETTDGLKFSDVELNRMANEAARQAVNIYNSLGKNDRYTNVDGPNELTFAIAQTSSDPLSYSDYEALVLLMQAQIPSTTGVDEAALKARAQQVIEQNLASDIDSARSKARNDRLGMPPTTMGYISARLGLELPEPLTISDLKLFRLINEGTRRALQQRDWLGRTERYSNLPGPDSILYVEAVLDSDPVSYPDLEVLGKFCVAQLTSGDASKAYEVDAFALIERNLQKEIEAARNAKWQSDLVNFPEPEYAGVKARIGLDMSADFGADGYKLSDALVGRIVNEAEQLLADSGLWRNLESEYMLTVEPDGRIVLPSDCEQILAAERCGVPLELKSRRWFYGGIVTRYGNFWNGWTGNYNMVLNYSGKDNEGNGNWVLGNGCVFSDEHGYIQNLRVLAKRKYIKKVNDDDVMLVQNFPALKMMSMSRAEQMKSQPDQQRAAILSAGAIKSLDNELNVSEQDNEPLITVRNPGLPFPSRRLSSWRRYSFR